LGLTDDSQGVLFANTKTAPFHSLHITEGPEEELKKKDPVIHRTSVPE
jgi:hypothetical protein